MKLQAYITGADRGLGLGLVKVLLEKDYKVYAGSYLPDWHELQEIKAKYPEDLVILSLDVNSDESVLQAAQSIEAATGSLNLLINNAGNAKDRSGTILDPQYFEDIRSLYETNTLGPLRVTQSVIKLLLKADVKTLVNISSVAGSVSTITRNHQYGYTMSKAAVNMQSKLIHNHLHDQGLKVLAIHPGWMRSHLFGDIERMKDAPLEPIESARSIIQLVESRSVRDDDQIYMDYAGNHLTW
jgi:NAD(P)-dependent dehydrogenase (short-subunit alcohol dehydrogenase family)